MISAIILAAGKSQRMGQPKMLMPWGETTVLGQVLRVISAADVQELLVVTGGDREQVELICNQAAVPAVFNPDHEAGDMLSSLQVGLRSVSETSRAALLVLGDQPGIEQAAVDAVIRSYRETGASLVVPSYQHRRGHPWLVARELWQKLLTMHSPETPRDFLHRRSGIIHYVPVDTPSILQDLDTPQDYLKSKP